MNSLQHQSPSRPSLKRFLLLFAAFFALYALTAQRGMGWGDSAEFQNWVLHSTALVCGGAFSNAHPFYVLFARLVAQTPYAVALVSSFFGALSVAGLYLCTRRLSLAVLFGLSQMLWWLSCVAEVQTMSLAFTVFATASLLEYLETRRPLWLCGAAFLAGLHLGVHNFALLAAPAVVLLTVSEMHAHQFGRLLGAFLCGIVGASYWLHSLCVRGFGDVLYGSYGGRVFGISPVNGLETSFNLFVASLSLLTPALLFFWRRKASRAGTVFPSPEPVLLVLFATHVFFFARYFVPDQSQFLLPTLFFAYLLLRDVSIGRNRLISLSVMQVLLPVMAYLFVSQLPVPAERGSRHPGRDEAGYFLLPWRISL